MFDKFHSDDRVGFIKFNKNCDIIFSLSDYGKNNIYLRNSIQDLINV